VQFSEKDIGQRRALTVFEDLFSDLGQERLEEEIRDLRRALSGSPGRSCQSGRSEPTVHRVVAWEHGVTTTKVPLGGGGVSGW
jgi:hypothetical protein